MKVHFFIFLMVLFFISKNCKSQCNNEWIKIIEQEEPFAISPGGISLDKSDNLYFSFGFFGTVSIGNVSVKGSGRPNVQEDIGIIKINEFGKSDWARQSFQQPKVYAMGMTTNPSGKILQLLYLNDTSLLLNNKQISIQKDKALVLAVYDSSGNILNLSSIVESTNGEGSIGGMPKIISDKNNNYYIYGLFSGSISFGDSILNSTETNKKEIYIAKFNETGSLLWVIQTGVADFIVPGDITLDKDENIIATGYFSGDANFDTINIKNLSLLNSYDAFIFKCNNNGKLLWAKSAGGKGSEMMSRVTTDDKGNIYATGTFSINISFGDSVLTGTSNSVFIVKYDNTGNVLKLKSLFGEDNINANNIALLPDGKLLLAGNFSKSIIIGSDTIKSKADFTQNKFNSYVIIYDSLVEINNTKIIESTGNVLIFPMQFSKSENIFVTGLYTDNLKAGKVDLNTSGKTNIFVWKTCDDYFTAGINENCKNNMKTTSLNSLKVYPNPSSSNLYFEENTLSSKAIIKVKDVAGRTVVLDQRILGDKPFINISSLPKGLYFAELQDKGCTKFAKFVKE